MEAGAKVDLRLKNGPYKTALQAAQIDVSQGGPRRTLWDARNGKMLSHDKAITAELLKGASVISKDQ